MSNIQIRIDNDSLSKHSKMMKSGKGVQVTIVGYPDANTVTGEIRVQFWRKRERVVRALKAGGACWGMAIVTVFIPLMHFVLVPTLLLAGPIMVYLTIRQESVVLGGEGTCPNCKAFLPIAQAAYHFPISDMCTKCQSNIKIHPVHGS
jgi:hypothetical protein